MRKVIAAINMTLDGFCDHTAIDPDAEIHQHYTDLITDGGVILYGRITYQLMQFWQTLIEKPSGTKSLDDFAVAIDRIPKIVFSHQLKSTDPSIVGWKTSTLANKPLEEIISELKQQPGTDILIGCRSLIMQLLNLNLIDELQLCVHPVVAGKGLPLFDKINDRTTFKLSVTKLFNGGAILLYYKRA